MPIPGQPPPSDPGAPPWPTPDPPKPAVEENAIESPASDGNFIEQVIEEVEGVWHDIHRKPEDSKPSSGDL